MSKTAKAALWIVIATMLSKILGFCRELVLANYYGTGLYGDVFLLTLNIPGLIIAVIGSAIATTYVPLYFKTKEEQGDENALRFTNNMLNICCLVSIAVAIMGLIFTEQFIRIFASGFEGEKFQLAVTFTKIMILGVVFLSSSRIFSSYLQVNDSFGIPALIGIPYSLIIIIAIVISTKTHVNVLAIGALIAMASQMLFQIPFAIRKKYKYKPYINVKDDAIKEMVILMLPMLIGVAIGQINIAVDRSLASTLGDGPLSALNYAIRLNDFVMALFVTSIVTVIYPKLAKMSNTNDNMGFINTIVKSSNTIILLVLPITVGAIVLAEPIVRILFERGRFDAASTQMTSIALRLYSVGLLASALRDILYRVFYSLSDTKTPMINGSIALVINIILNLVLIKPLGFTALALSTSIAAIITIVLLFISLKRKRGYFGADKIIKVGIKSLIASLIMGLATSLVYKYLYSMMGVGKITEVIAVVTAVFSGVVTYGIFIIVFKVDEIKLVFDMVNNYKHKLIKK